MAYLSEVTYGDYNSYSEDRLTQILSATFNHSKAFRKCLFRLLGLAFKPADQLESMTQVVLHEARRTSRIDLLINRNDKPYIFIENKVEAPLTRLQLSKYERLQEIKKCKKVAFVKHYFENISNNWQVLHWADIYQAIRQDSPEETKYRVEGHITDNLMSYLEEMGMNRIDRIDSTDLRHFAAVMNTIRMKEGAIVALSKKNVFETGSNYLFMLEEIINSVRQEPLLMAAIEKNFRFSPRLSWWYENEKKPRKNIMIFAEIQLKKKVNGISNIGTGLFLYNQRPEAYSVVTYAKKIGSEFAFEHRYPEKSLVYARYLKDVITSWKKWLRTA